MGPSKLVALALTFLVSGVASSSSWCSSWCVSYRDGAHQPFLNSWICKSVCDNELQEKWRVASLQLELAEATLRDQHATIVEQEHVIHLNVGLIHDAETVVTIRLKECAIQNDERLLQYNTLMNEYRELKINSVLDTDPDPKKLHIEMFIWKIRAFQILYYLNFFGWFLLILGMYGLGLTFVGREMGKKSNTLTQMPGKRSSRSTM
jgi:hypothetical protein